MTIMLPENPCSCFCENKIVIAIFKTLEITQLSLDKSYLSSSKSNTKTALKSGKLRFRTIMLLIFVQISINQFLLGLLSFGNYSWIETMSGIVGILSFLGSYHLLFKNRINTIVQKAVCLNAGPPAKVQALCSHCHHDVLQFGY